MPTSSPTPRPMPKPTGLSRDEIKARVRAKVEAEKALPASEQIANTLHAVRSTAEAQRLLDELRAEIEREVRTRIAENLDARAERYARPVAQTFNRLADEIRVRAL